MMVTINLHPIQRVCVNDLSTSITFSNEDVDGSTYYFTMTKEQFFAFTDAMYLIERGNMQGCFPLGQNVFFKYHKGYRYYESKLYRIDDNEKGNQRRHHTFVFHFFNYYKNVIHNDIVSFLRRREHGSLRRREHGSRRRHQSTKSRVKSTTGKRPLSNAGESSRKPQSVGNTREGETLYRSTNNVDMSDSRETSTILSKRCDSNHGQSESRKADELISHHLSSPENIQLLDGDNNLDVY